MRRSVVVAIALLATIAVGCAMERDLTWRRKKARRELVQHVAGEQRRVDAGVVLHTVVSDPQGEVLLEGCPPMRVVNVQPFGGIIDTAAKRPHICDPSEDPQLWYCSPEQERIVLHDDAEPLGALVYGSEGAGKTTAIAQWLYFRWLELLGERRRIGMFAPTLRRLGLVQDEIGKLWKPTWGRYVVQRRFEGYLLCEGTRILFSHTHKQSQQQGSPNQGANLSAAARDEMQDQVAAHPDIQSRGRSAAGGRYKQIGTATAKDDSDWRALRDLLVSSGKWSKHSLSIYRSPFVDATAFIANTVDGTISRREKLRRYGDPKTGIVDDLPPELAVYYGWQRARNLVARPQIATDVTATILSDYQSYTRPGTRLSLLVTHDPGVIYNTTEIARLLIFNYRVRHRLTRAVVTKPVPTWTVVGELQTSQTTAHQHARALIAKLQDEFYVEVPGGSKAACFVDPHGKGEGDTDYDTVYGAFQAEGLDVFNPAPMTGRIRRSQRVEMMNRLLGDGAVFGLEEYVAVDAGEDGRDVELEIPRLVVALNEDGTPCAPQLVKAFESLRKNPGDKNAEGTHVKDARDRTHAPASLSYGLWPFEQESSTRATIERALAEARRIV